jgi:hypothetical protein
VVAPFLPAHAPWRCRSAPQVTQPPAKQGYPRRRGWQIRSSIAVLTRTRETHGTLGSHHGWSASPQRSFTPLVRPRGRANAGPREACASVCLRGVQVIVMPPPRCCRHPSAIRTPPSPSITPVDVVLCDPRLGASGLWHCSDGRVEVRAGVRLKPATLVQLASACYALRQAEHDPVFRADDAAVHKYLWRCAFFAVVHPVARIEPPVPIAIAPPGEPERRASPLLLDVTRLETSADLSPLLDQILQVLQQRLPHRTDDACDVTAVSELCQNIFDHNAQTSGFIATQVMGCRGHRHLEMGVADYGAGLAATLQRNPQHAPLASDLDAIHLVVQRGTSASENVP